ncbi:MAG: NUDIX hydrolase [Acidimicrobiales bacterium]
MSRTSGQPVRDWQVGGAIVESPGGVLMVENRRRGDHVDWSPPGGVIDPGETMLGGLTREVNEETGITVHRWEGPVYEIEAVAPDLCWTLRVEVYQAAEFVGDLRVADPDGIVVCADYCRGELLERRLEGSPRWVAEPLIDFLSQRWSGGRTYHYRVDGADLASLRVTRL